MEKCVICEMPVKGSLEVAKTDWLAEETKREKAAHLFVSVFAPQHPKNARISNLCDQCLKDAYVWLKAYKTKRRNETKSIMWENLEHSL